MEGKNTESGINQEQSSQQEITRERQPINIDLNLPSYEEEMANIHFDRITIGIQNSRSSSGPIKKRDIRRGYYGQGEYVSSSTQASVLNNPLRTHFFPRFGTSFSRSRSNINAGVRTGILRLHGETPQASENNNGSTVSQAVRTFVDYAGLRNPWVRNTVHFKETIADSSRRYERNHPYLRPSPPPLISTSLQTEGSCVGCTNEENAEPEVQSGGSQDAGNAPPENQNSDVNQQQNGNPNQDNSICMFCVGTLIFQDPLNRAACGHYYHFRCLVTFNKPIEHPSSCFHCVWNQIQQDD